MPSKVHGKIQSHLLKVFGEDFSTAEVFFPTINRQADVVVESKKLVFEIQCSGITEREVRLRNAAYLQLGYYPIWILHLSRFSGLGGGAQHFLSFRNCYYTNFTERGGSFFEKRPVFFAKGRTLYFHEVDLSGIRPFVHTELTQFLKPHASHMCRGDIIDLCMRNPKVGEMLIAQPPRPSFVSLLKNYPQKLLDSLLRRYCS